MIRAKQLVTVIASNHSRRGSALLLVLAVFMIVTIVPFAARNSSAQCSNGGSSYWCFHTVTYPCTTGLCRQNPITPLCTGSTTLYAATSMITNPPASWYGCTSTTSPSSACIENETSCGTTTNYSDPKCAVVCTAPYGWVACAADPLTQSPCP
jgi:hypothetical protein